MNGSGHQKGKKEKKKCMKERNEVEKSTENWKRATGI